MKKVFVKVLVNIVRKVLCKKNAGTLFLVCYGKDRHFVYGGDPKIVGQTLFSLFVDREDICNLFVQLAQVAKDAEEARKEANHAK